MPFALSHPPPPFPTAPFLLGLFSLCLFPTDVPAAIAYDALTSSPGSQWLGFGSVEVAEDTTLDPAFGLTVTGATLRLQNNSITGEVSGTARFSIYQNTGGRPGALLTTAIVPLQIGTMTTLDFFIDLPDTTLADAAVWTSYRIVSLTQPAIYPLAAHDSVPIIGTTGLGYAFRSWAGDNPGPWTNSGGLNGFAWQIQAIPAPGASALLLAAAALAAARRHRC